MIDMIYVIKQKIKIKERYIKLMISRYLVNYLLVNYTNNVHISIKILLITSLEIELFYKPRTPLINSSVSQIFLNSYSV